MRSRIATVIVAAAAWLGLDALVPAQDPKPRHDEINKQFEDPALDVGAFIKRFESEDREVYRKREAIAAVLALKPGMSVADVGAGTGLYTRLFAEQVGPTGVVRAVDISRPFLDHIEREARRRGHRNIKTYLGTQTSTTLPPASCDAVFICDTYHHFEHPEEMLASIHQALRPGGRLVVVEFDRHEKASEFVRKHVRASRDVFIREIEQAGFEKVAIADAPELSENFIAAFRRRPTAESTPKAPKS